MPPKMNPVVLLVRKCKLIGNNSVNPTKQLAAAKTNIAQATTAFLSQEEEEVDRDGNLVHEKTHLTLSLLLDHAG